jgi:hypothetical protein
MHSALMCQEVFMPEEGCHMCSARCIHLWNATCAEEAVLRLSRRPDGLLEEASGSAPAAGRSNNMGGQLGDGEEPASNGSGDGVAAASNAADLGGGGSATEVSGGAGQDADAALAVEVASGGTDAGAAAATAVTATALMAPVVPVDEAGERREALAELEKAAVGESVLDASTAGGPGGTLGGGSKDHQQKDSSQSLTLLNFNYGDSDSNDRNESETEREPSPAKR